MNDRRPNDHEADRIRRMADEGTITPAEADRLLAVLDEIDGVEHEFDDVDDEVRDAVPPPPAAPRPPSRPAGAKLEAIAAEVAEKAAAAASRAASAAGAAASRARPERPLEPRPGVERWLRMRMLAGELEIRTRPGLDEIEIERGADGVAIDRDGDDWIVRQFRPGKGLLDRLVDGFKNAELTIAVPPGTGVDLDMKAGEVRIGEVPFVYGDVLAGEVAIGAARGIDLRMRAGEFDAALLLTEGDHHLSMTAGEATIRLIDGSSVAIDAKVSLGELNLGRAFGGRAESGISASWSGALGDGAARLDVRQSTGELNLETAAGRAGEERADG